MADDIYINKKHLVKLTDNGDRTFSIDTTAQIKDSSGRSNTIGVFGEQWATDMKNDVLAQFSYGKSTRELKGESVVGTGTVTIQDDNLLTVSTGTDVDGTAEIESYNAIRYRAGHTAIAQFTAIFTNPDAEDCHQWIGVADGIDGFAFGFIDGVFSVTRMRKGVHTHITDINGKIDIETIDFTKLNLFRVTYGYLGIAPVTFEILPKDGDSFVPIHTIRLQGKTEQTHIQLPYLPIKMRVENEGNDTDVQIRSGSWQGGSFGTCQECGNRSFHYPVTAGAETKENVGTTMTPLAAFRSKDTFQGFTNKIRARMQLFSFIPYEGDGIVTLQLLAGATITGEEGTDYNFIDIDSDNSVMEVSTDLTAFTGGIVGLTMFSNPTTLGSKQSASPQDLEAEALGLFLDPNQVYIIAAKINAGTIDIDWSVNWTELF